MSERLYLFLLPEPEIAAQLQQTLDALAAAHGGPPFSPHLTAYAGPFPAVAPMRELVERLAAAHAPLTLRYAGLGTGASFTKCVYARFEGDPTLTAITEAARALAQPPAAYRLDPHVSLLYGGPADAARAAEGLALPLETVRFDRLALIRSPGPSRTAAQVEAWEELMAVPLVGSGR